MEKDSKKPYFHRTLLEQLKQWIDRKEIYAIKGPRQSGKTTILRMLENWLTTQKNVKPENIIFITFEDREILEKFSIDPKEYIKSFIGEKTQERFYFLIDEFHYLKDGGQKLKLLYDLFDNIKFIITGSSSLELAGSTAKFLVGRLFSFHLWQLSFREFLNAKSNQLTNAYQQRANLVNEFIFKGKNFSLPKEDIFSKQLEQALEEYVIWGGYPEVIKAEDKQTKKMILKNIYDTYVSRDIIELLKITDYSKLRTILGLLSSRIGNLINYNNLAGDSQSYFKEIKRYLSILEETFIIALLRPFFTNKASELKKNPKTYFIDTGLRNYIIDNFQELGLRPDTGQLIENVVFSQIKTAQQENYAINYWRTLAKAEVDFILKKENQIIPIEVKYSLLKKPQISRGFRSFVSEYQPKRAVILTKNFWGEIKIDSSLIKFIPVYYCG